MPISASFTIFDILLKILIETFVYIIELFIVLLLLSNKSKLTFIAIIYSLYKVNIPAASKLTTTLAPFVENGNPPDEPGIIYAIRVLTTPVS